MLNTFLPQHHPFLNTDTSEEDTSVCGRRKLFFLWQFCFDLSFFFFFFFKLGSGLGRGTREGPWKGLLPSLGAAMRAPLSYGAGTEP